MTMDPDESPDEATDESAREFIQAREAAAILDVKLATLYAYVSRGLVRSVAGPNGRPRRYQRSDIERLAARRDARRGHRAVAAGALRWGEPVLDSSITEITSKGHRYRGRDALELADRYAFEEIAGLLWTGASPDETEFRPESSHPSPAATPWRDPPDLEALQRVGAVIPRDTPPIAMLAALIPLMAVRDPDRHLMGPRSHSRARAILVTAACALQTNETAGLPPASMADSPADATIAARLLHALVAHPGTTPRPRPSRRWLQKVRAMDQALIISADHELNVSAFAVRVTASAGSDLYACISAGLAALSGPLHGGMCDRIEALVKECGRPDRARDVIRERTRRGDGVPEFGHPLYPDGDPRGRALLATARALAPRNRKVLTADALAAAIARAGHQPATIDLGLVALAAALRLRPGAASALFAVGRIAGWIAHTFEQRDAGFMLRPRARYRSRTTLTEESDT